MSFINKARAVKACRRLVPYKTGYSHIIYKKIKIYTKNIKLLLTNDKNRIKIALSKVIFKGGNNMKLDYEDLTNIWIMLDYYKRGITAEKYEYEEIDYLREKIHKILMNTKRKEVKP